MKCLYLVTRSLDPSGRGNPRWAMKWEPALNAFAITFSGQITPTAVDPTLASVNLTDPVTPERSRLQA